MKIILEGGFMHRWQTCQPLSQLQRFHLLMNLATNPLGISFATKTIWRSSFEKVSHTSASKDNPAKLNLTCPPEITNILNWSPRSVLLVQVSKERYSHAFWDHTCWLQSHRKPLHNPESPFQPLASLYSYSGAIMLIFVLLFRHSSHSISQNGPEMQV